MPFRTARLLIPSGFRVEQVEVVPAADPVQLDGVWRIEYAGQAHSHPSVGREPLAQGNNRRVYDSDAPYPSTAAELISMQRLDGCDIALVRVFPVQYTPSTGRLFFTPEVTLNVSLTPVEQKVDPLICSPVPQTQSRIAAFVDNPPPSPETSAPASEPRPGFDYLLVTDTNLASAFQPLVEHKIQDGLRVKVATLDSITNTVSGRDGPERIRNYIRQAYSNWGVRYVLLGGNTAIIPCRYAYVRVDLEPRNLYLPTDLYYACLDGSWNGNDDRHWGEATDGDQGGDVDLLAEVFVGRAPVATPAQVSIFVKKTIRAETDPGGNLTNALLMATFLGDFPTGPCHGGDMFKPLTSIRDRFAVERLDDNAQELPQWTRTESLAALNRSPHVVLFNGHGTDDILMRLHTSDLKALTNSWPFLVYSVGCSAAEFDHGKFWPDSIGEAFVNGNRSGAFAAILNARAGWFDPQYPWKYSGEFQAQFFDELLNRGHLNLGMANQFSKEDLIGQVETIGGNMTYRWCYYGITLLGDPHLPFALPKARKVTDTERNPI